LLQPTGSAKDGILIASKSKQKDLSLSQMSTIKRFVSPTSN